MLYEVITAGERPSCCENDADRCRGSNPAGGGMDMVTSITSFGRSGLYDWMMQRVTAIVLLAYTVFMIGYLLFNRNNFV